MSLTPTTFVGLEPVNQVQSFCGRITRVQWIVVGFVLLSLLSLSLLIAVIVQARQHASEKSPNPTINPSSPSPSPSLSSTTPSSNQTNIQYCLNRGCLSAAAHQLRWIDSDAWANRCNDFYQYACGKWQRTHPIQSFDVERTVLGDILDQRDWDVERLLDSPIVRNDPDGWEWKLKVYFVLKIQFKMVFFIFFSLDLLHRMSR